MVIAIHNSTICWFTKSSAIAIVISYYVLLPWPLESICCKLFFLPADLSLLAAVFAATESVLALWDTAKYILNARKLILTYVLAIYIMRNVTIATHNQNLFSSPEQIFLSCELICESFHLGKSVTSLYTYIRICIFSL